MSKGFGNLILEKFKSNTDDEVIQLKSARLLSAEGTEYTHFFGCIHQFEVGFEHHRVDKFKGQDDVHTFELTIKFCGEKRVCYMTNEGLDVVGELGLIKTIKRICHEMVEDRLSILLGGDGV